MISLKMKWVFALLALPLADAKADEFLEFQLANECRPVYLLVEELSKDAEKTGLTEERIETAAESKLRIAGLYDPEIIEPYVYVRVSVYGRGFNIRVSFKRWVLNSNGIGGVSDTWETSWTGTHNGRADDLLETVRESIDQFTNAYFWANAGSC